MLNIVVPMAGRGSRFANAGYKLPKPLIMVHDKPMIQYVTNNIRPKKEHRFIYLCLQEHIEKYDLINKLEEISPNCIIVPVDGVTEGAACTVLLAEKYINNNDEMMIANSDQYVDIDINDYIKAQEGYDGLIMTMKADDPKWSFIKYEKPVAKQMIEKEIRVNGEYYVAPVYNEMIKDGKKITFYNIGSENNGMYGLGIPADLNKFLENPISKKEF